MASLLLRLCALAFLCASVGCGSNGNQLSDRQLQFAERGGDVNLLLSSSPATPWIVMLDVLNISDHPVNVPEGNSAQTVFAWQNGQIAELHARTEWQLRMNAAYVYKMRIISPEQTATYSINLRADYVDGPQPDAGSLEQLPAFDHKTPIFVWVTTPNSDPSEQCMMNLSSNRVALNLDRWPANQQP